MSNHKFHIPVMGIGFTVDTPAKVAQYGISSVISLVDDILVEKMRKFYCEKLSLPFESIGKNVEDFRAKRITAYLDVINTVVHEQIENLKTSAFDAGTEITKYFEMLPDEAPLKKMYNAMHAAENSQERETLQKKLREEIVPGSIDVNIMTKLDKVNYRAGEELPSEFNDAHAALRGFAKSTVEGSIILSAGLNSKLYAYMAQLSDFFPKQDGSLKKKIVLKVSDYRSALTQGKFLAKKGLWVSEYRIESGLNCGGHAFATQGFLMGPILQEFKSGKEELIATQQKIYAKAVEKRGDVAPETPLPMKVTVQGGVGTNEEHNMLLTNYDVDATGWGTPFLLVPEATNVDPYTFDLLAKSEEKDLFLSNVSPLGVPFNDLRGNSKEQEKEEWIKEGIPGSPCPKQFLVSNKEFSERAICTASRHYQRHKIEELEAKALPSEEHAKALKKIHEKECICVGLGTPALLIHDLDRRMEGDTVSVCPGPNMAYYSTEQTLHSMIDHIYGRKAIPVADHRPHMFIKELGMYVDYFQNMIEEMGTALDEKQKKICETFQANLHEGIGYYKSIVNEQLTKNSAAFELFSHELEKYSQEINKLFSSCA